MINIVTNKTVINQARETGRKTVVSQGVGIRNELLSCIADFLEVKKKKKKKNLRCIWLNTTGFDLGFQS